MTKAAVNILIPDVHLPFADEHVYPLVKDFVQELRPDQVTILGDFVDMFSISRFKKQPEKLRQNPLRKELAEGRKEMQWFSKHTKALWYTPGNHENRFDNYIATVAPQLDGLRGLNYFEQLGVDEYCSEYSSYGEYLNRGKLFFTHGEPCRSESAYTGKGLFEKNVVSMAVGHSHRLGSYHKTVRGGHFEVHELGCLCDKDQGYQIGTPNWQHGFGISYHDDSDGSFDLIPISLENGRFYFGGKVYK